jgi:hypothetical protein
MTTTFDLTAGVTSMRVLAVTKEAVYVRLPRELQRDAGGCQCEHCKRNPALAKWDTLVVPTHRGRPHDARPNYANDHTWTVHMPDAAVAGFVEYMAKKEAKQ